MWWILACAAPDASVSPGLTRLTHAVSEDTAVVPRSVRASRAGDRWTVTLTWRGQASDVRWTGSFAGWSADGIPLARGADGSWTATTTLPPGTHAYKLIVDGAWIADPANAASEPDGFTGRNSLLRLGRLANLPAAGARDGTVELGGVDHDPLRTSDLSVEGDGVRVRVRTLAGDADGVQVVPDGGELVSLTRTAAGSRDVWEAVVPLGPGDRYAVEVADGGREPVSLPAPFVVPSPVPQVRSPEWARGAVWYQVLPDRFRNGDPANDPPGALPWDADWYADPPAGHTIWERRFGGDFAGIGADLPRIRALGVNAIYLNPIWASPSPHHYDASTWVHVDPAFGAEEPVPDEDPRAPETWTWTPSDRMFVDLVARIHAAGMRVVIDGVFNHVGTGHRAWRELAAHGHDSPFASWFTVTSWDPLRARGWAGFADLPELAQDEDGYVDPAIEAHISAVTRRWMDPDGDGDPSDGIDGWRLDVADEIPAPFWRRWRAEVKRLNPDAVIVGEVWKEADPWLDGATFDGVTSYPWAAAVLAWASGDIGADEAARRITDATDGIPPEGVLTSWTLVDSHDTDRLRSRLLNPGRGLDQKNRADLDPSWREAPPTQEVERRARFAAALQAVLPGSPLIWYGDELGMWGGDDPHCRKPTHVEDPSAEGAWAGIFGLRSRFPVLRTGSIRTVSMDRERWVFVRSDGASEVLVVAGAEAAPEGWRRVWDGGVGVTLWEADH